VPGAEGPARLALTFERLLAGLDTLNCARELAWRIVRRVGLDCIPALRRRLLEHLNEQRAPQTTKTIAETLDLPTSTVKRALEDLAAYGLAKRYGQGAGKADVWTATDWLRGRLS
jgi:IclR helix-turn-helix domain